MRSVPRPDPAERPPPVEAYKGTVVAIYQRNRDLVFVPDEEGTLPPPSDVLRAEQVVLITAANPYSIELTNAENEERNAEAARMLDRRGIRYVPACGMDIARTWTEPGFALLDATDEEVRLLADEWCQHGIYRWDRQGWWLELTDGSAPERYPVRLDIE